MSKKKKILIISSIVVLLVVLAIVVTIIVLRFGNKNEYIYNGQLDEDGKYSEVLESGIKVNTSSKLNENKSFDGLDITDIKLSHFDNITNLTGTIKNNTDKKKGNYILKIIFLNEETEELSKMEFYVKELQPNESTILNASTVFDYTNAYDIKLEK